MVVKSSNRNGGRPVLPPERRRIRITITLLPEDVTALGTIDPNRSQAVHKAIQTYPAAATTKRAKETK